MESNYFLGRMHSLNGHLQCVVTVRLFRKCSCFIITYSITAKLIEKTVIIQYGHYIKGTTGFLAAAAVVVVVVVAAFK